VAFNTTIEGFLARRRHRGSWRFALKKAILYARKRSQTERSASRRVSMMELDEALVLTDPAEKALALENIENNKILARQHNEREGAEKLGGFDCEDYEDTAPALNAG